jgi:hypothetical protein
MQCDVISIKGGCDQCFGLGIQAYFGGQGRRYYVQHCATLGDIGNVQRKVMCIAGRNWATLSDIRRHWTKLNSNI